jgi:hypothetical protein
MAWHRFGTQPSPINTAKLDDNFDLLATANVRALGATGDGVTDDYAAFADAWAAVKTTGGIVVVPPGSYYLGTQWLIDVDLTAPHNYLILGYGAELLAAPAVTGHAIKVYKSFNNFGVTIEGLHFNHRNNTTVGGCIQAVNTTHLRVLNCSVEHHNTKAGYSGIELGPLTAGNGSTNSFWSTIDGFHTRQRAGGDGTDADIGINLRGQANATTIKNCQLSNVKTGIKIQEDGVVAGGIANGVLVNDNWFEGIVNGAAAAIAMVMTPTTGTVPLGCRIVNNRVESVTTFISITTGGAAAIEPSHPPIIANNYLLNGSVTNFITNPNNQFVAVDEPRSSSGLVETNVRRTNGSYQFRMASNGNLEVANESGNSNYANGHVVIGAYHLWVEAATGKLRIKSSAPTSDSDGTIVGTQA